MKRALSIAAVTLVGAFVVGAMFLLPPALPPEVIERSVIHEQTLLEKAWRLPTASTFAHHVDYQSNQSLCGGQLASLTFFVLSASQQITRKRFLLIQRSAGPATAFLTIR